MSTWRSGGTIRRNWIVLVVAMSMAAVFVSPAAAAPAPTNPDFTGGESQPVFPTTSASWINHDLYIESEIDSDLDGKKDLVHADVSRVQETDTASLKVPVVLEVSPYYAGTAPVANNWGVDHEIGDPPDSRLPAVATARPPTTTISTAQESTWVPRGFAVMHAESVGSGQSEGCPTSGGRNETLGAKAVIDWINGRVKGYTATDRLTELTAYWATGSVGMIGTSYNGTIPNAVATTGVPGLDAIIPVSAISNWYDYYRANGMVRAPGGFQGEDLDVLAEYVYSRLDRDICKPIIADVTANLHRDTGDSSAFWEERNYMTDIDNVHAAVLMAHGNNDWNVMTKNMAQFYNAIKARGVPHQLYLHQGGHGGQPTLKLMNRWFTRYLWKVQNGVENDPKAWIVREGDTTANPTPYAEWPDPSMAYANMNFTGNAPARGELTFRAGESVIETLTDDASISATTLANAASSPNRLAFITEPLLSPVRVSGTPLVSLNVAFSKPKDNLTAILFSLATNGTGATIISRGWMDPENRSSILATTPLTVGQPYQLDFDMQPKDSVVAAGRRVGIMVISSDNEYTVRPAAGTQLNLNVGASHVSIPVVGGAAALAAALGITAPDISYTLNPPSPTGQNGWYTGTVSIDWTVDDGGADSNTNGCVDTTYSTDGVRNPSCAASNVAGSDGPVTATVKRDATSPMVTVGGVTNGATYTAGSVPAARCNTTDATSGVASQATLSLSGGTLVGSHTASCSGGTDVAGNANSATPSATYNVIYAFRGFLGIYNPPRFQKVLAGGSVALKFKLGGNFGLGVISSVTSRLINCTSGAVVGATVSHATTPLRYAAGKRRYIYAWQTQGTWSGTCREVLLTLNDGTTHTARFKLK
jgi:X-Pro dipeptidyl-peptidase